MNRPGFSLIEALVALLLLAVVLGGSFTFFSSGQSWSARAAEQAGALGEMRIALARITHDVRGGRQLIYPAPGHRSQPGLGLVGSHGEIVFYLLVPGPAGSPAAAANDLVRQEAGGTPEVVLHRVTRFLATVDDCGPGPAVRLAHLVLSRALSPPPSTDGLSLVTSAAIHAPRHTCLAAR